MTTETETAPTAEQMELRRKVLNFLRRHPERHDQSLWLGTDDSFEKPADNGDFCGTTMCIAGATMLLHGDKPTWKKDDDGEYLLHDLELKEGGSFDDTSDSFATRASFLLGLDPAQAEDVFYNLDEAEALAELERLCQ